MMTIYIDDHILRAVRSAKYSFPVFRMLSLERVEWVNLIGNKRVEGVKLIGDCAYWLGVVYKRRGLAFYKDGEERMGKLGV